MKLLIAEDDPVSRTILETRLAQWRYDAVSVADGEAAARVLASDDPPRLVVLDWMMPGKDGVELCREIRARDREPYTYVILLTAKGERSDIIAGLDAGADDYITKPFDAQELRVRLRAGRRILELQDQLIRAREELRERATHDPLTGLLNRGAILEFLKREHARSERDETPLAIVMADLDHFKSINDRYGHAVGDQVLTQVAQAMGRSIRRYDGLGRYGGEEFLLVLPGAPLQGALHQAERMRKRIGSERLLTVAGELGVTASLGVAWWNPEEPTAIEALLRAADEALYEAKRNGRSRVEAADRPRAVAPARAPAQASRGPGLRTAESGGQV